MKRSLRFYFALFFARATALVLKLIGRKGTSMPGSWAIILCPDFLGRMPRPETVIGITGTNGKTTVANMVEDILQDNGYDFVCNRMGTNVHTGVASALIANSYFFGKPKKELAIFEIDERSAPNILPYIKPDLMLCTNIFRDSFKRNAHMEYITGILERNIPRDTRLILNSDDLLCSEIAPENKRVYFGIERLEGEGSECRNIVCDVVACPKCGKKLKWDFIRYHHIGRAYCEICGFSSKIPEYSVTGLEEKTHTMNMSIKGEVREFKIPNTSMINAYNALCSVALLAEFGVAPEKIEESMSKMDIDETRYRETPVGEKRIVMHLAKGQNPIACSRAFDNIRSYEGKKAVILFLDDYFDATRTVENIAWLYDTDFEFLNDESIVQILIGGARHLDVYTRLLIAGVPRERMSHINDNEKVALSLEPKSVDTIFILYDVYTIGLANRVKGQVADIISGRG